MQEMNDMNDFHDISFKEKITLENYINNENQSLLEAVTIMTFQMTQTSQARAKHFREPNMDARILFGD